MLSKGNNKSIVPKTEKQEIDMLIEDLKKNKSMLLINLWKFGIPNVIRKSIWTLVIGNSLEITPNLYEIL